MRSPSSARMTRCAWPAEVSAVLRTVAERLDANGIIDRIVDRGAHLD